MYIDSMKIEGEMVAEKYTLVPMILFSIKVHNK